MWTKSGSDARHSSLCPGVKVVQIHLFDILKDSHDYEDHQNLVSPWFWAIGRFNARVD